LAEFRIHKLVEFCLCVSLERLTTLVLSIPEGVVERRTAVHPVCAFTSIRRDCVGCSSVRGRVIVSVVRRVDSLAVHCLFTRSRSDNLSSSQILREDRATTICYTCCIDVCISLGRAATRAKRSGEQGPAQRRATVARCGGLLRSASSNACTAASSRGMRRAGQWRRAAMDCGGRRREKETDERLPCGGHSSYPPQHATYAIGLGLNSFGPK
jgi:hypothetical protein